MPHLNTETTVAARSPRRLRVLRPGRCEPDSSNVRVLLMRPPTCSTREASRVRTSQRSDRATLMWHFKLLAVTHARGGKLEKRREHLDDKPCLLAERQVIKHGCAERLAASPTVAAAAAGCPCCRLCRQNRQGSLARSGRYHRSAPRPRPRPTPMLCAQGPRPNPDVGTHRRATTPPLAAKRHLAGRLRGQAWTPQEQTALCLVPLTGTLPCLSERHLGSSHTAASANRRLRAGAASSSRAGLQQRGVAAPNGYSKLTPAPQFRCRSG